MSDLSIDQLVAAVRPHLSKFAFAILFERSAKDWREVGRYAPGALDPSPLLPESTVLDYAADSPRPTYLPEGEEGSEFCLLDVRSALYYPLDSGRRVLYIAGETAEAFSPAEIEAAWKALSTSTSP